MSQCLCRFCIQGAVLRSEMKNGVENINWSRIESLMPRDDSLQECLDQAVSSAYRSIGVKFSEYSKEGQSFMIDPMRMLGLEEPALMAERKALIQEMTNSSSDGTATCPPRSQQKD